MGECGLINRLVAGSSGVLAVGGFERDRAEVDPLNIRFSILTARMKWQILCA